MMGWVEWLADAGDPPNTELRQGLQKLLECELDSLDEPVTLLVILGCLNGSFKIVNDGEQFLENVLIGEAGKFSLLLLRQFLIVFKLGCQPKVLLVQRLGLLGFGSEGLFQIRRFIPLVPGPVSSISWSHSARGIRF